MKYRGVNLGGWLVLEKWMTPSLFEGMSAVDETTFCTELGPTLAAKKLTQHRDTFITLDDLQWIKAAGLNAVRLPVPYWLFKAPAPYVSCLKYVDWLVEVAGKIGLQVLLDVHAAPGSQNGNDHSGRVGSVDWTESENVDATLVFIDQLVKRYGQHEQVMGFELLNEPDPKIDHQLLLDFYKRGVEVVHSQAPDKLVVVSDAYRPHDWAKSGLGELPNVVLDVHLYQAFSMQDKQLDMAAHVDKATIEWHHLIDEVERTLPVIVGEWSLGLAGVSPSAGQLTAYGVAQLTNFDYAAGWFFWNYKTESGGAWSFRDSFEKGLLPGISK